MKPILNETNPTETLVVRRFQHLDRESAFSA
jgi:hypothetical protein